MRVLHLLDSPRIAGTELHVLALCQALREQGLEPILACPAHGEISRRAGMVGLPTLPFQGRILSPSSLLLLARAVRDGAAEVVHVHDGRTSLAAALALVLASRGKMVATQHFIAPSRLKRRGIKALVAGRMHRWVERRVSRFIAISTAVRNGMIQRGDATAGKIAVVPNGIMPAAVNVKATDPRQEFGLDADEILIACAARLELEKDLQSLVEAMAELVLRYPRAICVIAGEGSQRGALERRINALKLEKNVRLLGFRNDVPAVVRAADMFVLPCPVEGFGLSIVEAMALGRPVIATAAGGPLEIVDHGQTGLLVPPSSPKALGEAILRLANDPALRQRMGEAGYERFRERFTAERMAAQTADVYRQVLSGLLVCSCSPVAVEGGMPSIP